MRGKTANLILVLTVFLVITIAIAPIGNAVEWTNETRLTTHQNWDAYPSIAQTQDDRLWFVWQSDRGQNWVFDIYHVIYDRWWGTWSAPLPLTNDSSPDITPSLMQTNDGTIWLFWASTRTGNYDLFFKNSFDNGITWTNATQLTTDPERDLSPSVIQDTNGTIWVVWRSNRNGVFDLFFKNSFDNGITWTNATQLTTNVHNDVAPSIAQMQDGTIWVVWQYFTGTDSEIFYKTHNGSWSSAAPLVENPDFDWEPSIMQSRDGMIWVFWSRELWRGGPDPYQDDLFYKTSDDNGVTWTGELQLTTDEDWNENGPSAIHSTDRMLWLTWHSDKDDNFDIYYMQTNMIINRDVAITDVIHNSTVVYQGETVPINVTAENQGERRGLASEVFTVDCYANTTLIGSEVVSLRDGESTVIVFSWNTSNFAFGTYIISANASAVPFELPINLDDNTFIDGTIQIKILGDINGDGAVDWFDFGDFALAFGSSVGDSNYNVQCDFDLDGAVDWFDFGVFAENFGS